jgi:hypothetical protein
VAALGRQSICALVKGERMMSQWHIRDRPGEETTFKQVNTRCREVSWPDKSALVDECNVMPDSAEMPEEEMRAIAKRFWNQYVYPQYENTYFRCFPVILQWLQIHKTSETFTLWITIAK